MKRTAFLLTVGAGLLALGLCGTWAALEELRAKSGIATTPPSAGPTTPESATRLAEAKTPKPSSGAKETVRKESSQKPNVAVNAQFPVTLSVDTNLWLPLNASGTGFLGGMAWLTPPFTVRYANHTFDRTNAVRVIQIVVQDEQGKEQQISLSDSIGLPEKAGAFVTRYFDPFGSRIYSGQGKLRLYLKKTEQGDEPISNTVEIFLAVSPEAKAELEKKHGPPPKDPDFGPK